MFLLALARKSMIAHITGHKHSENRKIHQVDSDTLFEKRGRFISIKKNNQLIGCPGCVLPTKPLCKAIEELSYEVIARDAHFTAIKKEELEEISIEIAVLSHIRKLNSIDEIQTNSDGLYIIKGTKSGILLPQEIAGKKLDRDELLQQLCGKAGPKSDDWKFAELYSFSAEIFGE